MEISQSAGDYIISDYIILFRSLNIVALGTPT